MKRQRRLLSLILVLVCLCTSVPVNAAVGAEDVTFNGYLYFVSKDITAEEVKSVEDLNLNGVSLFHDCLPYFKFDATSDQLNTSLKADVEGDYDVGEAFLGDHRIPVPNVKKDYTGTKKVAFGLYNYQTGLYSLYRAMDIVLHYESGVLTSAELTNVNTDDSKLNFRFKTLVQDNVCYIYDETVKENMELEKYAGKLTDDYVFQYRVVDKASGKPLPNYTIRITSTLPNLDFPETEFKTSLALTTDEDGYAQLTGLNAEYAASLGLSQANLSHFSLTNGYKRFYDRTTGFTDTHTAFGDSSVESYLTEIMYFRNREQLYSWFKNRGISIIRKEGNSPISENRSAVINQIWGKALTADYVDGLIQNYATLTSGDALAYEVEVPGHEYENHVISYPTEKIPNLTFGLDRDAVILYYLENVLGFDMKHMAGGEAFLKAYAEKYPNYCNRMSAPTLAEHFARAYLNLITDTSNDRFDDNLTPVKSGDKLPYVDSLNLWKFYQSWIGIWDKETHVKDTTFYFNPFLIKYTDDDVAYNRNGNTHYESVWISDGEVSGYHYYAAMSKGQTYKELLQSIADRFLQMDDKTKLYRNAPNFMAYDNSNYQMGRYFLATTTDAILRRNLLGKEYSVLTEDGYQLDYSKESYSDEMAVVDFDLACEQGTVNSYSLYLQHNSSRDMGQTFSLKDGFNDCSFRIGKSIWGMEENVRLEKTSEGYVVTGSSLSVSYDDCTLYTLTIALDESKLSEFLDPITVSGREEKEEVLPAQSQFRIRLCDSKGNIQPYKLVTIGNKIYKTDVDGYTDYVPYQDVTVRSGKYFFNNGFNHAKNDELLSVAYPQLLTHKADGRDTSKNHLGQYLWVMDEVYATPVAVTITTGASMEVGVDPERLSVGIPDSDKNLFLTTKITGPELTYDRYWSENMDGTTYYTFAVQCDNAPIELLQGDVNMDGIVNYDDCDRLLSWLAGNQDEKINEALSDVDGEEGVTYSDLYSLMRYVLDDDVTELPYVNEIKASRMTEEQRKNHDRNWDGVVDVKDVEYVRYDQSVMREILECLIANRKYEMDDTNPIPGDADGDGKVTLSDAVLILKLALGIDVSVKSRLAADVDASGSITLTDAQLALKLALGISIH